MGTFTAIKFLILNFHMDAFLFIKTLLPLSLTFQEKGIFLIHLSHIFRGYSELWYQIKILNIGADI